MKKWFFLFLSLSVFLISCKKSDPATCSFTDLNRVATGAEISFLQAYMSTNSISAVQDASGVFYVVGTAGIGNSPNVCSNITVNYTGTLLSNNAEFDSNNSPAGISFVLGQLILGWQKGLPKIKAGGSITLYIPPSLAYGTVDQKDQYGVVVIPGNSYLKFVISLRDVQ